MVLGTILLSIYIILVIWDVLYISMSTLRGSVIEVTFDRAVQCKNKWIFYYTYTTDCGIQECKQVSVNAEIPMQGTTCKLWVIRPFRKGRVATVATSYKRPFQSLILIGMSFILLYILVFCR